MSITKATVGDTGELTKLVNSAYRGESSKAGWTSEAHLLDGTRIDEVTMASYFKNDKITILKYENDQRKIEGCVYLELKEGKLYLGMLTVAPDVQAAGIGRKLLQAAEIFARDGGLNTIFMTVIHSRQELLDWYVRRGFRPTGEKRPFPAHKKFGIVKQPFELIVLEKVVN